MYAFAEPAHAHERAPQQSCKHTRTHAHTRTRTHTNTVYLVDGYNKDMQKAKYAQSKLELTTLRGLTAATEIYYDPDPANTVVDEDCMCRSCYFLVFSRAFRHQDDLIRPSVPLFLALFF